MSLVCKHRSSSPVEIINEQPVFDCDHPRNTTERAMIVRTPGVAALQCTGCTLPQKNHKVNRISHPSAAARLSQENGWEWVSMARMQRDVRELLLPKLPLNLSGVAGCPRSGMTPAAYLSTLLHLPLYEATTKHGLRALDGQGTRSKIYGWGRELSGPVLVVEDSTYGGGSLAGLRRVIGDKAIYATVYHRPNSRGGPDFFARELESPHFFEWHCFNSGHMNGGVSHPGLSGGSALDMDGLICHDPPVRDDAIAEYEAWLPTAAPRWVPRALPCKAVLTARLEKYRSVTLDWLARHHVRFDQLIMRDVPEYKLRGDTDAWKAGVLAELGVSMYFESSERHARRIHSLWGGVVICPPSEFLLRAIDK